MSFKATIQLTGSDTSSYLPLDHHKESFNTSIFISVPSGVTGNVSVEISGNEYFEATPVAPNFIHGSANPLALVSNSTHFLSILSPCTAIRFVGDSIAGGSISINILQSGSL
jgi:hypothetical protein